MFSRPLARTVVVTGGLGLTILAVAQAPAIATPGPTAFVRSDSAGMVYTGSSAHTDTTFTLEGSVFRIVDTGPIKVGPGCAAVSGNPNAATCTAPKNSNGTFKSFTAHALAGDDYLLNQTPAGMVGDGGDGRDSVVGSDTAGDRLAGGEGGDRVLGRGGVDRLYGGTIANPYADLSGDTLGGGADGDDLTGGRGDDVLRGGDGDDRFIAGGSADGSDDIRGEAGAHDVVDYSNRDDQIEVALGSPDSWSNGEAGEDDRIRTVEDVLGSIDAPNFLLGNADANKLTGGDAKDWLAGGSGADHLIGGGNDDSLLTGGLFPDPVRDGSADTARGGNGFDLCLVDALDGDAALQCEQ